MKWVFYVVGVLLVLMGAVWALQGINVIPVGFMAGHFQYTIFGLILAAAGIGLLMLTNRRSKSTPKADSPGKNAK